MRELRIVRKPTFFSNFDSHRLFSSIFSHKERASSFLSTLILSYWLIIIISIGAMGVLTYNYAGKNIRQHTIELNNDTLIHFKNQIDNLLLENINQTSLKIYQDCHINSYLSYYMRNPLIDNISDLLEVKKYVDSVKLVDPAFCRVTIYFEKNDLLVSTDCTRHTLYSDKNKPDELDYYKDLIGKISFTKNVYWYYEKDYPFKYGNMESIPRMIHFIRKIPSKANTGGAIIISIDEEILYENIKKSAPSSLDNIIIVDYDGTVISHSQSDYISQNINNVDFGKTIINSGESSGYFTGNLSGTPSIISYTTSDNNNWRYINITPLSSYNNNIRFLLKAILLVSMLTILFGLTASVLSARRVNFPISNLVSFCKKISNSKNTGTDLNTISSIVTDMSDELNLKKKQLEKSYPILKINLIRLLSTKKYMGQQEIDEKLKLLNIELPYKYFTSVIVQLAEENSDLTQFELEVEKMNIIYAIEKNLSFDNTVCLCGQVDDYILAVINTDMEYNDLLRLLSNALFPEKGTDSLMKQLAIGIYVSAVTDIVNSYQSASSGIKYSYIYPEQKIFGPDLEISENHNNKAGYKKLLKDLETSLKSEKKSDTFECIDNIICFVKSGSISIDMVFRIMTGSVSLIEKKLTETEIADELFAGSRDMITYMKKMRNINLVHAWLVETIHMMYCEIDKKHTSKNKELIESVTSYITANIGNQSLSLKSIADAMYISPNHLSKIFKDHAGITFVDFLSSCKVKKGKELLLETDLKVEEISSMVGYATSQYFIRKFKIEYGVTPKDFRIKNGVSTNLNT